MGRALPRVAPSPCLCCPGPAHVLIIEATSPAGGVPVLPQGVGELLVQGVSKAAGDALPGQDEDDDDGVLAVVARPVPHQAEQLLLQRVPADHLQGGAWARRAREPGEPGTGAPCSGCHTPSPLAGRRGRGRVLRAVTPEGVTTTEADTLIVRERKTRK